MRENELKLRSGWPMFAAVLVAPLVFALLLYLAGQTHEAWPVIVAVILAIAWVIVLPGFMIVNPNEARVIQLFGKYVGTVKDVGFFHANPLYWKRRVSLRVQTFETGVLDSPETKNAAGVVVSAASRSRQPSKVNDRDGTPIEISAVVVYRVVNAAEAVFQVDNCAAWRASTATTARTMRSTASAATRPRWRSA